VRPSFSALASVCVVAHGDIQFFHAPSSVETCKFVYCTMTEKRVKGIGGALPCLFICGPDIASNVTSAARNIVLHMYGGGISISMHFSFLSF